MGGSDGFSLPQAAEKDERTDSRSSSTYPNRNTSRHESAHALSFDERMDQMQAEIRATHQMMRELSSLVHRQLKVSPDQCELWLHTRRG